MGAKAGIALKSIQWIIRAIQLLCAALVLGIFSYFLATLHNHDLNIDNSVRAVEGISGAAVLYTLIGLLLLCCVAGLMFASIFAILLDVAFIGCFIYVAVVNKKGAGSCDGYLDTPFGQGQSSDQATGSDGFTALPSFRTACRLQRAAFAVSIALIFFFLVSIVMELVLVRHHRKAKKYGPGPQNGYTSGYGRRGFFSRFRRTNEKDALAAEDSQLPEHTHPDQLVQPVQPVRQSYGTDQTAVTHDPARGPSADYHKQEAGAGYAYQPPLTTAHAAHPQAGWHTAPQTTVPPESYRYGDGVYERA